MEEKFEHLYISFYTATVLYWKKLLKQDKYKEIIINSLSFLVKQGRIKVYGFVIMPNHFHLLWKIMPSHTLWGVRRDFMKFTSQQMTFDLQRNHPKVLEHFKVDALDRAYQIWERNPLDTFLYLREVIEQKLDYIHNNPIQDKWNLVQDILDYKYSSIRFYEEEYATYDFLSHYMEIFE